MRSLQTISHEARVSISRRNGKSWNVALHITRNINSPLSETATQQWNSWGCSLEGRVVQGVEGLGVKKGKCPTYGLHRLSGKSGDGVASCSWWIRWLGTTEEEQETRKWTVLAVSSTWFEFVMWKWDSFVCYCLDCYMMFASSFFMKQKWLIFYHLFWYRFEWYKGMSSFVLDFVRSGGTKMGDFYFWFRVDYDAILCDICLWVLYDFCNGYYVKKKRVIFTTDFDIVLGGIYYWVLCVFFCAGYFWFWYRTKICAVFVLYLHLCEKLSVF